LRRAAVSLAAALATLAGAAPGFAREHAAPRPQAPLILVRATVSDRARSVMPPELWARLVAAFAGSASRPLADDFEPGAAGCRAAGGDYLVDAAFDLRDDLPGLANASDRFAGRVHVVIVACDDARILTDRRLRLDGEPVSAVAAGTPDALDDAWRGTVPAALADAGVAIGRIARVRRLEAGGELAHVDFELGHVRTGAILSDTNRPDGTPRRPPLQLTVTAAGGTSADAIFGAANPGDQVPSTGDIVEYD
jgi:hypothetical protein